MDDRAGPVELDRVVARSFLRVDRRRVSRLADEIIVAEKPDEGAAAVECRAESVIVIVGRHRRFRGV